MITPEPDDEPGKKKDEKPQNANDDDILEFARSFQNESDPDRIRRPIHGPHFGVTGPEDEDESCAYGRHERLQRVKDSMWRQLLGYLHGDRRLFDHVWRALDHMSDTRSTLYLRIKPEYARDGLVIDALLRVAANAWDVDRSGFEYGVGPVVIGHGINDISEAFYRITPLMEQLGVRYAGGHEWKNTEISEERGDDA